ncbi:hypothetical protein FA039_03820 [Escherichia coli]|nr:hypothetical protein [Escherichia coli]
MYDLERDCTPQTIEYKTRTNVLLLLAFSHYVQERDLAKEYGVAVRVAPPTPSKTCKQDSKGIG